MRSLIWVFCAAVAGAAIGTGCSNGDGGPATPADPFRNEQPPKTGSEPATGGARDPPPGQPPGGSIEQLCAYDCMRFEQICPGASGGSTCAAECTQTFQMFPNCTAEAEAYLGCLSTTPASCSAGNLQLSGCDAEINALSNCANLAASK